MPDPVKLEKVVLPKENDQAITFDHFFSKTQVLEAPQFDLLKQYKGSSIYTKMLEDDQISICLNLVFSSITERRWYFEGPNSEFFEQMIKDYKGPFKNVLKNLLYGLVYGYILLEKIYEQKDGKWIVNKVKPKPVNTFKFDVDKYGNIVKLLQKQREGDVELDLQKFLYYVYQPHFHPQFGRSILYPAYRHYWAKDNILKFWNIWMERAAVGFIHGKVTGELQGAQRTNLEKALKGISAKSYILTPGTVDLSYVAQRDMSAFNNAVRHRDSAIARSIFIPHTLGVSPQDATGTNAQTSVHFEEVFFNMVKDVAEEIADVLNEQLFGELEELNFGVRETKYIADELLPSEKRKLAKSWSELIKEGAVQRTFEDENHVRTFLDFPEITKEDFEEIVEEKPSEENPVSNADFVERIEMGITEKQLSRIKDTIDDLTDDFAFELQDEVDNIIDQVKELTQNAKKVEDIKIKRSEKLGIKKLLKLHMRKVARKSVSLAKQEVKRNFTLSPELIDAFINSKTLKYLSELIDSAIVEKAKQIFINGIKAELSSSEISDQLVEYLKPYSSDLGSSVAVDRLVRTAVTEVFNEARKAFFESEELNGYVQAYQYSAILDEVTTDFCKEMHGKTWPVDDPRWKTHTPPNHFNCRSLLIPVTEGDKWETSGGLPQGIEPKEGFGK